MAEDKEQSAKIFISYARRDHRFRDELIKHLSALKRSGFVSVWSDRDISVGADWKEEIDVNLMSADVIVFLLSPDFIASDYCYEKEASAAFDLHEDGEAALFPVVVRSIDTELSIFEGVQALPRNGKALSSIRDRDSAWVKIIQEFKKHKAIRKTQSFNRDKSKKKKVFYPPPFAEDDFKYKLRVRAAENNDVVSIPCTIKSKNYDCSFSKIGETIENYLKERSKIIYLEQLELWNTSLKNVGKGKSSDYEKVKDKFQDLVSDYVPSIEPIRILLAGETGAGKTTLIKNV